MPTTLDELDDVLLAAGVPPGFRRVTTGCRAGARAFKCMVATPKTLAPCSIPQRPTTKPWPRASVPRIAGCVAHGLALPFHAYTGCFRERIATRAFDETLQAVAAGEAEIFLLADHDPSRELARTGDGSLKIWQHSEAGRLATDLMFSAALPDSRLGREIATALKQGTMSQVSVGYDPLETSVADGAEFGWRAYKVVERGRLREISLVEQGAFYGTWCKLFHNRV